MKLIEMRQKTVDELKDAVLTNKRELLNLRLQQTTGQLTNPSRFRKVRRETAQLLTLIQQQQAGQAPAASSESTKKTTKKAPAKKTSAKKE